MAGVRSPIARLCVAVISLPLLAASAPAQDLLLADDFDRADLGRRWTPVADPGVDDAPGWAVEDGALRHTANIYRSDREYDFWTGAHIVTGEATWRDYELAAQVTSGDDDGWGVIVRYHDPENYYRFVTVQDGSNEGPFRRLEKFVAGEREELAASSEGFSPGRAYDVRFCVVGKQMQLWIDGELCLEARDAEFSGGAIGFLAYANDDLTVDDVRVRTLKALPAATGPPPPDDTGRRGQEEGQDDAGVIFSDDFERNALGPLWAPGLDPQVEGPHEWTMADGRLKQLANIWRRDREYDFWTGTHIVAGRAEWAHYELAAKVRSVNDDDGWGAIVRFQDAENYYRFVTVSDGSNGGPFRRLERFVGGERYVLDETDQGFETDELYELRFRAQGPELEVLLDGESCLEAWDAGFQAGKFGFLTYANGGLEVDDVVVRKLPGPPPLDLKAVHFTNNGGQALQLTVEYHQPDGTPEGAWLSQTYDFADGQASSLTDEAGAPIGTDSVRHWGVGEDGQTTWHSADEPGTIDADEVAAATLRFEYERPKVPVELRQPGSIIFARFAKGQMDGRLFLIDMTKGKLVDLYSEDRPACREQPSWSVDGRRLLYAWEDPNPAPDGQQFLRVLDMEKGTTENTPFHRSQIVRSPVLAPDQEEIAFHARPTGGGMHALHVCNFGHGRARSSRLIAGAMKDEMPLAEWPTWSPDGKTIAFHGYHGQFWRQGVYTITPTGGERTRISDLPGGCGFPSYSPDGSRIAFYRWDLESEDAWKRRRELWVMGADGSDPSQITDALWVDMARPNWSPDGSRIVLSIRHEDTWGVHTVDVATGQLTRLTGDDPAWRDRYPAWRPE